MAGARWAREAIRSGALGEVHEFTFEEGGRYGWPITTASAFLKELAGGGVLIDTGAHTLDLLWWWLGSSRVKAYRDDNQGGVEADCEVELELENGGSGKVTLSRTRTLANTARINGALGRLEVSLVDNRVSTDPARLAKRVHDGFRGDRLPQQSSSDLFVAQLAGWLQTLGGASSGAVPAEDGLQTLRIIRACYERRLPLKLPWMCGIDGDGTGSW